jgi:hypothetical protein
MRQAVIVQWVKATLYTFLIRMAGLGPALNIDIKGQKERLSCL